MTTQEAAMTERQYMDAVMEICGPGWRYTEPSVTKEIEWAWYSGLSVQDGAARAKRFAGYVVNP